MQCHLSWDSYRKNICNGFSSLQQKEEFVDMTIAAEGHLVKVHRNLIALASPYIKEMLKSASCQHPVIFLNNVSNEVLCYILEYIYTGEVGLPVDKINTFIEAAKALRIVGLETLVNTGAKQDEVPASPTRNINTPTVKKSMKRPVNNSFRNVSNIGKSTILRQLMVQNGLNNESDLVGITADDRVHNTNDVVDLADADDRIDVRLHENLDLDTVINPTSIRIDKEITDIDIKNDDNNLCEREENDLPNNFAAEPTDIEPENMINWKISIPNVNLNRITESDSSHGPVYNYNLEIKRITESDIQSLEQTSTSKNSNQLFSIPDDVNTLRNTNIQLLDPTATDNYNEIVSIPDGGNDDNDDVDIDMQPQEVQPPINNEDQIKCPMITIKVGDLSTHHDSNFNPKTNGSSIMPDTQANAPIYALSNKGSLQLILNRYMYYLHHRSGGERKRRWRCIDYRRQACKAFIDTDGEIIMRRQFEHPHPYHDDKIVKKGRMCAMYTSIHEASCASEEHKKDDDERCQRRTARDNFGTT